MSGRPKAIISWSSGKDSAFALHQILQEGSFDIACLVTTVTESYQRVAMHGVREELLDLQAHKIGLPLHKIRIPSPCTNEIYEEKMGEFLAAWKQRGVRHVIFGDLFLEDIRRYREHQLSQIGMEGVFPLWGNSTSLLAKDIVGRGFKAILTCVDLKKLPKEFAGRPYNEKLLFDFPKGIDFCGENGEFHTFVYAGPIFNKEIPIQVGETVEREGFAFADILLQQTVVR